MSLSFFMPQRFSEKIFPLQQRVRIAHFMNYCFISFEVLEKADLDL